MLFEIERTDQRYGAQPRKEPDTRLYPRLIEQHVHDCTFTFSRKISFSDNGSTSMLSARNMRTCSVIESRLRLGVKETVRTLTWIRSIPGSRKSRSSTGSGNTARM